MVCRTCGSFEEVETYMIYRPDMSEVGVLNLCPSHADELVRKGYFLKPRIRVRVGA